MAKTYIELTQQILQLQAQAEARRLSEAKGVIRTINEAIATYGLTAADLKFAQAVSSPTASSAASLAASLATSAAASPKALPESRPAVVPKSAGSAVVKLGGKGYSDGAGNNWTGRGPRPKWLREALAAGDSISKYEVTGQSKPALNVTPPTPVTAKSKALASDKPKLPAKFRNVETGDVWSGRGMKPKWLRQAIASGRHLAEFDVLNGKPMRAAVSAASVPAPRPAAPAVKAAAKSIPAKKAAPVLVSAKKAVPARRQATTSVPAKKVATAVKATSKKAAAVALPSAKKLSSASVKAVKPTNAANALQASTAQAHVPVTAVRGLGDAAVNGTPTPTPTTAPGKAELVSVQLQ